MLACSLQKMKIKASKTLRMIFNINNESLDCELFLGTIIICFFQRFLDGFGYNSEILKQYD